MFDKLKAMSAIGNLMKNQDKLKEAGARVRARMSETRIIGEAGGGAARATMTGTMRVVEVQLSPALVAGMAADARTHELAGSLIAEAVNNAIAGAQQRIKEAVDREAKEMGLEGFLPELGGALGIEG